MNKPDSIRGKRCHTLCFEEEKGAVLIESIPSLFIFLISLLFLIELARFSFYTLTTQFVVAQDVRFAVTEAGVAAAPSGAAACCLARVAAIRNRVASDLSGYYVGVIANDEIFVCDALLNDCNICDDASQTVVPPGTCDPGVSGCGGPGFVRNRFLAVRVRHPVNMALAQFGSIWTLDATALAKVEGNIRDCAL